MSARRALITGITGQDGSYLAELLAADGTEVHGFVRPGDPLVSHLLKLVPSAVLHAGDLANTTDVIAAVVASAPDEVYHLAAASSVAKSWEDPITNADLNGTGAVRFLDATRKFAMSSGSDPRFLLASSAEIFGQPAESPQNELTLIQPVSPYGSVKAFAYFMVQATRQQGLHASTVILYNHESPRRPDTFVTRKITKAVARIANGSTEPLVLGNVSARRDWGFAGDYVRAMRDAVRADEADDFIVATGVSHSIEDLVATAFAAAGITDWKQHTKVDESLIRPNDPASMVGDASKAREVLGWKPEVNFDELVHMMVEHDLALASADQA